ncbi:hypothetical protein CLV58_1683 [Spirosoma oryzae]|uniref:Transmembrane protein n=1 Tax=Spirosoma oryzae TaxID=1469603 RepID=A0A2T0RET2_9BACT|nr:hypothetical protein [Spirosoma oryzae]PRY19704.1 hypothetical protein CLV58_1683 [Spirosoma oryzae]
MISDQHSQDKNNDLLNRIKEKSEDDFEKQLTFIASSALGVSFAFLEKLVDLSKSVHVWILTSSWILLSLALCVNLISHYVSRKLAEKSTDDYNKYCDTEMDYSVLVLNINRRNNIIDWINYSSIIALLLGLCLLITFVTKNISHVSKDRSKTQSPPSEQRGRTIPVPPSLPKHNEQTSKNQPVSTQSSNKPSEK